MVVDAAEDGEGEVGEGGEGALASELVGGADGEGIPVDEDGVGG